MLTLLALPALLAVPAAAAKKDSEAEIQARIDAEMKALEAERDAAAAARQIAPAPSPAATPVPPAPAVPAGPVRIYKTVPVILTTSLGAIRIAVEVERAPLTSANFLRYVDEKRLDDTLFYRSFTFAPSYPDMGLIQGGTQNDPRKTLKPVQHEPTNKTGLTHDDGAVSLARDGLNSGTSDFFIIVGGMKALDAGSGQNSADDQGFAVFGHVTEGMDIVRSITKLPHHPTKGEGAMKGQMLEQAVKIITARRAPSPPPAP